MFQWQKVKLAMAVRSKNAHYRMAHIHRRHWNTVAKANGLGENFEPVIQKVVAMRVAARRLWPPSLRTGQRFGPRTPPGQPRRRPGYPASTSFSL
jgi:hypothetical protein